MKQLKFVLIMISLLFVISGCQESTSSYVLLDLYGNVVDQFMSSSQSWMTDDAYEPEVSGYLFDGWYLISYEDNIYVYQATYIGNEYKITFETNGGNDIDPISVTYKDAIPTLPIAEKEGYYFSGWYLDTSFTQDLYYQSMPYNDLILYAKWSEIPFTYIIDGNKASITSITYLSNTFLEIPETIDGYDVVSIELGAFDKYPLITDLTLPKSITYLPQGLLKNLTKLEYLRMPFIGPTGTENGPEMHLSYLFYDGEYTTYTNLDELSRYIPYTLDSLTLTNTETLASLSLSGTSIQNFTLVDGDYENITIEGNAFIGSMLRLLFIPATVTNIAPDAFVMTPHLSMISVHPSNPNYKNTYMGTTLTNRDETVLLQFANGIAMSEYTVSDGILDIGEFAFAYNQYLVKVNVPDTVTSISGSAFAYTASLTTVLFNQTSQLRIIGDSAFNTSSIVYIDVPDTVTSIGFMAFHDAKRLERITFTENSMLSRIMISAFDGVNSLREITIPQSVITIDRLAFVSTYPLNIIALVSSKPLGWDDLWYFQNPNTTVTWLT